MRVAIIETMENTRLGNVASALAEVEAETVWFRARHGEPVPSDDAGYNALIVPGGWPSTCEVVREWRTDYPGRVEAIAPGWLDC